MKRWKLEIRNKNLGVFFSLVFLISHFSFLICHADWPQWRGADRAANAVVLPDSLATPPALLWEKPLEGDGISGVVATESCVIAADRDRSDTKDIFRCFDATTGEERWRFSYNAPGRIDPDYGSSPRATPLIHGDLITNRSGREWRIFSC